MSANSLIDKIKAQPEDICFDEVISFISENYRYTPTRFTNGTGDNKVINETGTNEGSCKIFAFAQLNALSEQQTLSCFGDYYRDDVLAHPEGDDHANIRAFMRYGWAGIHFDADALVTK